MSKELQYKIPDATRKSLDTFHGLLAGKTLSKDSPILEQAIIFCSSRAIAHLPSLERERLQEAICKCFQLTQAELLEKMTGISADTWGNEVQLTTSTEAIRLEKELWSLIPKGGYLEQYSHYTKQSEAPLAYHIFCALVGVGLLVGRKVYFNMGHYKLYPPLGVFLLGPSGLRKTSAANIILKLIQSIEVTKVYPEKFTPEAVTLSIAENAQGLLYAPEMSATLGKQKYLEGLIPLLTRLQDCPDEYYTDTIGRGKVLMKDVAVSMLMCSTPDWFIANTPTDMFGGGFIARQIMVMQEDTPREEHIPVPRFESLFEDLRERLLALIRMKGEMHITRQAYEYHKDWYHNHKIATKHPEHPLLATYFQRKPDHMKRIAMCMQLAENYDMTLTLKTVQDAISILNWIEKFIPPMLNAMFRTALGEMHDFVLGLVKANGGMIKHSDLVRKVQHKMDASRLRTVVGTLKEAKFLFEAHNNLQHVYFLERKDAQE